MHNSVHLSQETQRLSERTVSADKTAAEEEEQSRVVASPQEDIHDIIREKGVGGWGLRMSGWSLCMSGLL